MHHSQNKEIYTPVLKIWKKGQDGLYRAPYDDLMMAIRESKYSIDEIESRLGRVSERLHEALRGHGFYQFELRALEIAMGVLTPKWQEAFKKD